MSVEMAHNNNNNNNQTARTFLVCDEREGDKDERYNVCREIGKNDNINETNQNFDDDDEEEESSYEYICEEDDDNDELESSTQQQQQQQEDDSHLLLPDSLIGRKRSASETSDNNGSSVAPLNNNNNNNPPAAAGAAASADQAFSLSVAPHSQEIQMPPATCLKCGTEHHAPIVDCTMARTWSQRQMTQPVAVQVVPFALVQSYVLQTLSQQQQLQLRRHWGGGNNNNNAQQEIQNRVNDRPGQANYYQRRLQRLGDRILGRVPQQQQEPQQQEPPQENPNQCLICLDKINDPTQYLALDCRHRYCRECWTGYLHVNLNGPGALAVTCPAPQCAVLVPQPFIADHFPPGLTEFHKQLVLAFVTRQAMLRACPGPDCDQIAIRATLNHLDPAMDNLFLSHCGKCDTKYCFRCGEAPHGPCRGLINLNVAVQQQPHGQPMEQAEREQILAQIGVERTDRMKPCPGCQTLIEKIGGCNRMRCRCRYAFCWLCLADMTDGYNHMCGQRGRRGARRQGRAERQEETIVVDLDRVMNVAKNTDPASHWALTKSIREMHRFGRAFNLYFAHNHGQRFATEQQGCLHGRINNFNHVAGFKSATDPDFIASSNETLVVARRVLKYSFAYAYEMGYDNETLDQVDSIQVGLFQSHQERLVRFTEELSELSENPLTQDDRFRLVELIAVVKRCIRSTVECAL